VASLLHWLELVGRISRSKSGSSYELRLTPNWRSPAPVPAYDVTRSSTFGDRICQAQGANSSRSTANSGCGSILCALLLLVATAFCVGAWAYGI
jgi:hypothetical protein